MKAIGILLAGAFLPTTMATAQDRAPETPGWQRSWTLTVAPVFGADRNVAPFPVGDEVIDESEFGAGLGFERSFGNGASLTFTPAASYSPNQFDAEEPASALSFSTVLKTPVTTAVRRPDSLSWVISHSVRADFDEAFED